MYKAIGLMSGTSLDGIDVALVETDGENVARLIDFSTASYEKHERDVIRAALGHQKDSDVTAAAADVITTKHIDVIKQFGHSAEVIGFHGQTIFHDPGQGFTWQIGDPQKVADAVNTNVVADMRQADVKAGGQGAPLLPLCHRAFAKDVSKPIAILNLGGVGNITWLGESEDEILAFDTGPANALMDDLLFQTTGQTYDRDGEIASRGSVDQRLLDQWMENFYFSQVPPKSLDRDQWDVSAVHDLSLEDGMAILAEFTVRSVEQAVSILPTLPNIIYVSGGGRENKFLMRRFEKVIGCGIKRIEELGWNGDALEAQGFAYLAVRSLKGLHLTVPQTTGVSEPLTGGVLYKPNMGT